MTHTGLGTLSPLGALFIFEQLTSDESDPHFHQLLIDDTMLFIRSNSDEMGLFRQLNSHLDDNKSQAFAAYRKDKYDSDNIPKQFFIVLMQACGDYKSCYHFDGVPPLQVFYYQDWQAAIDAVASPADFLTFLKYRQNHSDQPSTDQVLVQQFLHDPVFFQRAWQVEKCLQIFHYMKRISDPIKGAVYKKQASISDLVARQQQASILFDAMITAFIKAHPSTDLNVLRALLWQSGYTRMKVIEFILSYASLSDTEKQQGVVRHEHAYHRLGQHFILVIYGKEESSALCKTAIAKNYRRILQNFYTEFSGKSIDHVFLLGFDLSYQHGQDDTLTMDVYY